jgi:nickel-dependent lactate racemase
VELHFPYLDIPSVLLPDTSPVTLLEPRILPETHEPTSEIIKRSLEHPIHSAPLRELAIGKKNILILADDHSRHTPAHIILPLLFDELSLAGVNAENIRILVASGTHRSMSTAEKSKKFGAHAIADHVIIDHRYKDPGVLVQLPTTPGGTEIWINRMVLEADLLIGIGHIVPHRVAGFTGGCKIVQPGVCGTITTGQTHWLSAQFPGVEIIGKSDNPVRREIDAVASAVGLKFILNVVMDARGNTAFSFSGDPVKVFQLGAEKSLEIFGAPLSELAEIVIADSYPTDMDLWIAAKGIYAGDLALKEGGILIFVTPCFEGISPEYPGIVKYGYHSRTEVQAIVSRGEITDLALAAHLVHVGEVICRKGTGILISPGIAPEDARKIGFLTADTPQRALEIALDRMGKHASITVLKNGGEIMPILRRGVNSDG